MPHLTLVEKGSGKSHRIEGAEAVVGRDPACGVFLEGEEAKTVSGRHARFFSDEAGWYVEDAGSRNGTYIGTRKLEPGGRHKLAVGDIVGLGLTGTQLGVREVVGRAFAATMVESVPAVPTPARVQDTGEQVRVVLSPPQGGARLVGQGDHVTIGRALECLIRVEGEAATSVSRVHAEISVIAGMIVVRDGGSRHGTFVNGIKLDGPSPLKIGDVLMLGPGGPTFNVDELNAGGATSPSVPAYVSPETRDASVGPTGVRGAAKAAPAQSDDEDMDSRRSTPGLDQPAYMRPTSSKSPPPAAAAPRAHKGAKRLRAAGWGAVVGGAVIVAVIVAVLTQKKSGGDADSGIALTQQAAALEASRTAALNEEAKVKASLDSAVTASAPSVVVDSLRQALADASRRSATLEDSLRRTRPPR